MLDGVGEIDGNLDGALFSNVSTDNVDLAVDFFCTLS